MRKRFPLGVATPKHDQKILILYILLAHAQVNQRSECASMLSYAAIQNIPENVSSGVHRQFVRRSAPLRKVPSLWLPE